MHSERENAYNHVRKKITKEALFRNKRFKFDVNGFAKCFKTGLPFFWNPYSFCISERCEILKNLSNLFSLLSHQDLNFQIQRILKVIFFAVAALKQAWLLSCCLLRQPAGSEPEPNCFTLYILSKILISQFSVLNFFLHYFNFHKKKYQNDPDYYDYDLQEN